MDYNNFRLHINRLKIVYSYTVYNRDFRKDIACWIEELELFKYRNFTWEQVETMVKIYEHKHKIKNGR